MMTLKEEMRQIHKQLSAQGKDGVFNEALVTELAAKQAELTKQMIIEKERTKASLFAVLTPEQREKAEQLKTDFKGRFRDKFKGRWGKFE
jgi:Spy/CpxP family protein refolding chaperone